jgi:dTDP-4-dehydrorhamnose reductase
VQLIVLAHDDLDICNEAAVHALINTQKPDVIINAAAYTAVDRAESEPEQARRVNEQGPRNLAQAAAQAGSRLIHISTDYVFDGASPRPYRPDDETRPLNVYGATKLAGEDAVRAVLAERSVVLRTAWVYGATGQNFVRTMLRLMKERGVVRIVADQIGTPTSANSVARAIWKVLQVPRMHGIYHWTEAGVASWYDFAVAINEEAAALGMLQSGVSVSPIATEEYPTPARRPRLSVLDSRATTAATGLAPAHWRVGLREVLGELHLA